MSRGKHGEGKRDRQVNGSPFADEIGGQTIPEEPLLADRAYDSDALRSEMAACGVWAKIKPMPGRERCTRYLRARPLVMFTAVAAAASQARTSLQPATTRTPPISWRPSNSSAPVSGAPRNESSCNCGCFPRASVEAHTSGCRILKEGSSHEALCRIAPVDGNHAGLHR